MSPSVFIHLSFIFHSFFCSSFIHLPIIFQSINIQTHHIIFIPTAVIYITPSHSLCASTAHSSHPSILSVILQNPFMHAFIHKSFVFHFSFSPFIDPSIHLQPTHPSINPFFIFSNNLFINFKLFIQSSFHS